MIIKNSISAAAVALTLALGSVAFSSCSDQNEIKPTRNLIVMIPDGFSTASLSACRWYKTYAGMEDQNLAVDPYICGLVTNYHIDSPICGSAGAMTQYMTGTTTRDVCIGVYPPAHEGQEIEAVDPQKAYHPLATVLEASQVLKGRSAGLVATVVFPHATPAATASHSYSRYEYQMLAEQMAGHNLDVMYAGGLEYVNDRVRDNLEYFGTPLVTNRAAFDALGENQKSWALFGNGNMEYDIDRDPSDEPSIAELTDRAIKVLSSNKKGFFLMVEGSKVDYASHSNDPSGIISEFLAFDEAVRVAIDFARKDGNTTVVILPDHGNSGFSIGKKNYSSYSSRDLRSAFGELGNYKISSEKLTAMLSACAPEDVDRIIKENLGIEITDVEHNTILKLKGVRVSDYMQVSNSANLASAVTDIMNARTQLGFTHGNHTGEDVFLAVYNPNGQVPSGRMTFKELNNYLCAVSGFEGKLPELSEKLFTPYTDIFSEENCTLGKDEWGGVQLTVVEGQDSYVFSQGSAYFLKNGEKRGLPVATVYLNADGRFYLPSDVRSL